MKTKICTKCHKNKELSEFGYHPTAKFDVQSKCKECRNKNSRDFYIKNKEKINKKHKSYNDKNKEKIRVQKQKYYQENKKVINKKRNVYKKKKYKEDINYKILDNLRSRLKIALNKTIKSKSTLNLLGCTVEYLKQHLESQFTEGMTWDNHSLHGWHIDHIKSCASFDLTKLKEQRECFHYTNLQPLWAIDNWSKK